MKTVFSFEDDIMNKDYIYKYALLILYSESDAKIMKGFFDKHFKEINNGKGHIDIYTHYNKDLLQNNIAGQDILKDLFDVQGIRDGYQSMADLRKKFNVIGYRYPTVIVINKDEFTFEDDNGLYREGEFFTSANLELSTSSILYRYIKYCIEAIENNPNCILQTLKSKIVLKKNDIRFSLVSEERGITPRQYIDSLRVAPGRKMSVTRLCEIIGVERHKYNKKLDGKVKGQFIDRGFIVEVGRALNLSEQEKESYCEYFSYLNIKKEELVYGEIAE